jgi:hypothetical protein
VFLEAGVEFVWGTEGVDVAELNNLFEKVGWLGWQAGSVVWRGGRQ